MQTKQQEFRIIPWRKCKLLFVCQHLSVHAYLLLRTWRLCIVCIMDGCVFVNVCGRYVCACLCVLVCVICIYMYICAHVHICEYGCVIFMHVYLWYINMYGMCVVYMCEVCKKYEYMCIMCCVYVCFCICYICICYMAHVYVWCVVYMYMCVTYWHVYVIHIWYVYIAYAEYVCVWCVCSIYLRCV